MDRSRLWAALTGAAGLLTLAVTVAFQLLPQVTAAGDCMPAGAVIEFEFAKTVQELVALFGAPANSCRAPMILAVDAVNTLDVFAYIPAYTAFCVFAALWIGGDWRRPPVLAAIGIALIALAADYVETINLLAITKGIEASEPRLIWSSTAAWIKFGALAAHALVLAGLCLSAPPRRWILGLLLILPAYGVAATWMSPMDHHVMTLSFVAAWTPLMALALWRAVRPPAY